MTSSKGTLAPEPLKAPVVQTGLESDDKIAAVGSDVIGILQMVRMGSGLYWRLAGSLAWILSASAAVMVSARCLGRLVETLVDPRGGVDLRWRYSLSFMVLEALAVAAQYFGRVSLAKATIEITYRIRTQLFEKMSRLPIAYFDVQPLGRTITRLTSDVEGIETFFNGTLARVLIATINIASVLVAMVLTDLHFGSTIVAVCVPALLFTVVMRRPVVYWLRTYKRRSAHLNAKLAEYLNGLPVIKIFGLEEWTQRQFTVAADELLSAGIHTLNWNSFIRPFAVFLCSLPSLLVLALGGPQVVEGAMQLGMLVAFVRFSERFVAPTEPALRAHLAEFRDHGLLVARRSAGGGGSAAQQGGDELAIPLSAEVLARVLDEVVGVGG